MPPKKDKGKKGKKEKKEKNPDEPLLEIVDENTRQFFLLQIKDLEEKLKRYQTKCDEIEILCKKYEAQYETSNADKKDIVSNLNKELQKKTDDILDLSDRLVGLQQAKDSEKEAFEKQLTDLRTEFQETKDTLTNQNNTLLAKLTALEEFKSQKEELLAKLDSLQEHIDFLELDHKNKLNEIEKKVIIDKDRLKKEMIIKVSQVAAEFRRVSNKQMADTTKRTIKENVSINAQLQKMSDKVVELIEDTDSSKTKDKIAKQQINLLEDNEKELARKNVSNLKVIRLLTEKCRQQESIIAELDEKYNEMRENEIHHEQIVGSLENRLDEVTNTAIDVERLEEKISHVQGELEKSQKYRVKIEKVLKQASDALVLALSKSAAIAKNGLNTEEFDLEWNDMEKRDNMLEHLLILLNSAASLGFGPNPEVFSSEYKDKERQEKRPRTSKFPASGKGIRKNQIPLSELGEQGKFNSHYRLGDLGIVPRNEEHLLTNFEKSKLNNPRKELGSIQKLIKKTVATQTIDFTRASMFGIEENSNNQHPIFDSNVKKGPSKTQILMPINGQHRVTDKVF